ncbi:putative cupintype [Mycena venus]|uniref:Putative cupintype n=1 Tax=Mycena venus TaxID=2733690 RepID=A0A8H7CXD0_9AGAR|nr:putative cupintype [Mycena venus]
MPQPLSPDVDSWTLQEGISMTVLQNPLRTRVIITGQGKKFYVPPHWHAAHDENHVVIKGRVIVTQDGVRRVVGPEDGVCLTRRGVVHSLESFPGEELILEETASEPEDGSLLDSSRSFRISYLMFSRMLSSPLGVMQVFYYGDSYPKLPTEFRWLKRGLIVVVGGWIAPFFGYQLPDKRLRLDPSRFPRDKKD